MKKYIPTILIIALAIACLFSIRGCIQKNLDLEQAKTTNQQLLQNLKPVPLVPLQVKPDKQGVKHYVFNTPMISHKADILQSGYIPKAKADSIRKVIMAKDNEISDLTQFKVSIQAKLRANLKSDSAGRKIAQSVDSIFNIKYLADSNLFNVKANIKLTQIDYVHKPFLGKPRHRTEIFANDPRITISEVYKVQQSEKPPNKGFLKFGTFLVIAATTYFILK